MSLTAPQLQALKTAIDANPAWAAFPLTADGYFDLAAALNITASPNFWVWATNVDIQAIKSAIVWAYLTPTDVPDGTQAWANRSLQCQGKQFNLQLIIPVTGTLDASKQTLRDGLQDALTGVRSGAGGVAQNAGWNTVRDVLSRRAKYGEKILADITVGDGSTRSLAATMVFEGNLQPSDIEMARSI